MSLPRIIAVCGIKRSGKDTISDLLCKTYGYQKIKVAQGLKDMLRLLFDLSEDQLEGDAKDCLDPKLGVTPRKLMQFMGTDVMQYELSKILPGVGRNFWINRLVNQHIERCPMDRFVISDMRFLHEYRALERYQPYVIRVERKESTPCDHVSETEYKDIPCNTVYKNDGSLHDIERYIKSLFNQT